MKRYTIYLTFILLAAVVFPVKLAAQPGTTELLNAIQRVGSQFESLSHRLDVLEKKIDDIYWYDKVGDVAWIDKVYMTGPPPANNQIGRAHV